ncbi:hypothetical protein NMG60_11023287 [Bertholletia excelsa]
MIAHDFPGNFCLCFPGKDVLLPFEEAEGYLNFQVLFGSKFGIRTMEFTDEDELTTTERLAKRKMEAHGSGSSGEVRRIHIIYFLSHKGRIEQPHLIRVHHLSRNGVRLRDVKRWLSELRGKAMPESFAWSYKRRYKTGYVWQDLLDEDLITPISDNEYILKGSEIPFANLDLGSNGERELSMPGEQNDVADHARDHKFSCKEETQQPQTTMMTTKKTLSEIEDHSPPSSFVASTLTDDSTKLEEEKHNSNTNKQEKQKQSDEFENGPSFYSLLLNSRSKKNKQGSTPSPGGPVPSPSSFNSFSKSKSYSSGVASSMLRSLIPCGTVDTSDSAMVKIRRGGKSTNSFMPMNKEEDGFSCDYSMEIYKDTKSEGSQRIFGTP